MLGARILSIISPLVIVIFSVLLFPLPEKFYLFLGLALAVCLLSLWLIFKKSPNQQKLENYFFLILIGLLSVLGLFLSLLFFENIYLKIIFIIFYSGVLLFYYNSLFKHLYLKNILDRHKPFSEYLFLEAIIILTISISLFGFSDFLNSAILLLISLIFILTWLLAAAFASFYRFKFKKHQLFHFISALVSLEFFWALISLPLAYYIKGILFSIFYLGLMVLRNNYYGLKTEVKVIKHYLILAIIILILVLSTSRWF